MMNILELFSGSGILSRVARERGHTTTTIDNNAIFKPDLIMDIMDIDLNLHKPISKPKVDFIWASPPCQCFSVASISTHWKGGKDSYTPNTEACKKSIELVKHTINIIKAINPKWYAIENPRGVLRKLDIIPFERKTIMYCQYGDDRMKPTDIWSNIPFQPKTCYNGCLDHVRAPRGSRTGTQGRKNAYERGILPKRFCEELFNVLEKEVK